MTVEATVPLALEDALPVALSAIGCVLLAVVAGRSVPSVRRPALLGAAAVTAGGAAKVTWKLILAFSGHDVHVLAQALFGFLAVGFVLLAWALLAAHRGRVTPPAVPAGVLLAAAAGAVALHATGPLLGLAVVAATVTGVVAVLLARRAHDGVAVAGFVTQVVAAYALVPFTLPPQSVGKQWGEQLVNTVGQAAFALAAWRLCRPAAAGAPAVPDATTEGRVFA